jgi:predicted dehydrogenase
MADTVKLGMIGLGARAETLLATIHEMHTQEIQVTAICDVLPNRI